MLDAHARIAGRQLAPELPVCGSASSFGWIAASNVDGNTPSFANERTVIVLTPLRRKMWLACHSGRTSATWRTGMRAPVTGDVTYAFVTSVNALRSCSS